MRYADFKPLYRSVEEAHLARQRVRTIEGAAYDEVAREGIRRYEIIDRLGVRITLRFDASHLTLYNGRPITFEVHQPDRGLSWSSDALAVATDCVRHIEAWIAGEVDDLLPSGPWLRGDSVRGDAERLRSLARERRDIAMDRALHEAADMIDGLTGAFADVTAAFRALADETIG